MKTCPNCNKTNIPNEAQFCPDCGMWLSHEGLITTLANDPEGHYYSSGGYCPTKRERMALDYMKEEDSKISDRLWKKYDQMVYLHNKTNTSRGEISWVSYNTENVYRLIHTINNKLEYQYGVKGDWIVNENMFSNYKESHSLLLRVGREIYSILIVYKIEGFNVVHCRERLLQEVECQKDGYIPCHVYLELHNNEDGSISDYIRMNYKHFDMFHVKTGKPVDFTNVHVDRNISNNEIMLLAIREFTKERHLSEYKYTINDNVINIYNTNYWNEYKSGDHYILEVNDLWGNDKIERAKKLRSECFSKDSISGNRRGREPDFFKVNIHSHFGGSPTYDDYVCDIEQCNFNKYSLMTEEERKDWMKNISSLSFSHLNNKFK